MQYPYFLRSRFVYLGQYLLKRRTMLKQRTHILSLVTLLFAANCMQAQTSDKKISNAYESFSKNEKLKNGISSLTVLNGKTGETIYSSNASIGLPTASTQKVITSITALDILGADFTFKTTLSYAGQLDTAGVLTGDIVVTGTGDPTLGSDRYQATMKNSILNKWTSKIKDAGIKQITGRIIIDDLFLNGNDVPGGWTWTDIGNYYGAGISGVNWGENKIGLTFRPGSVGSPAQLLALTDSLPERTIVNNVSTAQNGSGDNVYAYSAPYSQLIYLRGTYGKDLKKVIEISDPNPALTLAHHLRASLNGQGVRVDSMATTGKILADQGISVPKNLIALNTHESPKLFQIVHWFNKKSINLYGEALLKSIGFISGNRINSDEASKLMAKYWEQKLDIPTGELRAIDGSGLSPQARVTTMAMSKIMHYAQSRPWFTEFNESLPTINGMTMKSGTIGGVLGYTGYQKDKSGNTFVFTLLVNNYSGGAAAMRRQMYKVLDTLK